MFKLLIFVTLLTSPLMAYNFDNYFNFKTESGSNGNSYKVATKEIDNTKFKAYVEVSRGAPQISCVIVAFGAITQATWNDADLLALTLNIDGDIVQVQDLIGGSGTNFIQKKADIQDWNFMSNTLTDKSYTYSSGIWKVEVQRNYEKRESSKFFDVKKPGENGVSPVAINVFNGACPTGQFDFGTLDAVIGGFAFDSLKPTRQNNSLLSIFGLAAMIFTITFSQ